MNKCLRTLQSCLRQSLLFAFLMALAEESAAGASGGGREEITLARGKRTSAEIVIPDAAGPAEQYAAGN